MTTSTYIPKRTELLDGSAKSCDRYADFWAAVDRTFEELEDDDNNKRAAYLAREIAAFCR